MLVIRNRHFVYPKRVRKTDPIIVFVAVEREEARMNWLRMVRLDTLGRPICIEMRMHSLYTRVVHVSVYTLPLEGDNQRNHRSGAWRAPAATFRHMQIHAATPGVSLVDPCAIFNVPPMVRRKMTFRSIIKFARLLLFVEEE